jgi:phosphoribosylanthranilate isomerase
MIFDFVTITGADDKVDQVFLDDMATQYPHVEWGILFSVTRAGTPRYPSQEWITSLVYDFYPKWDTSFSAHLCGAVCRRLIKDVDIAYLDEHVGPLFSRLQLNSFPEMTDLTTNVNALASRLRDKVELVLPIPNQRVEDICKQPFLANVSFLYDGSRGLGVSPESWPETELPLDAYVGFAGGITVDNVKQVLDTLCSRESNRHFWIDLESGARTDDQFDRKKVEKILKITEGYLG